MEVCIELDEIALQVSNGTEEGTTYPGGDVSACRSSGPPLPPCMELWLCVDVCVVVCVWLFAWIYV